MSRILNSCIVHNKESAEKEILGKKVNIKSARAVRDETIRDGKRIVDFAQIRFKLQPTEYEGKVINALDRCIELETDDGDLKIIDYNELIIALIKIIE